jgi:hypothetical protein
MLDMNAEKVTAESQPPEFKICSRKKGFLAFCYPESEICSLKTGVLKFKLSRNSRTTPGTAFGIRIVMHAQKTHYYLQS